MFLLQNFSTGDSNNNNKIMEWETYGGQQQEFDIATREREREEESKCTHCADRVLCRVCVCFGPTERSVYHLPICGCSLLKTQMPNVYNITSGYLKLVHVRRVHALVPSCLTFNDDRKTKRRLMTTDEADFNHCKTSSFLCMPTSS